MVVGPMVIVLEVVGQYANLLDFAKIEEIFCRPSIVRVEAT
jgi:hypothetical protein